MSPVDLDDRLDNPLLHTFHPVQLFVQDLSRLHRIYGFKVIALPLDIHHNRERPLRMAAFFLRYFMRTGHSQISSGPETDIVGKRSSRTGHEIRNTLDTGEFHLIAGFFLFLTIRQIFRGAAGKKPGDHKLKESVLRGELRSSSEGRLTDPVHCVPFFPVLAGKTHTDTVLTQPADQTDKARVDLQDIRADLPLLLFFELKRRPVDGIGKDAAGMMLPLAFTVVQIEDRSVGSGFPLLGMESSICTLRMFSLFRSIIKIKNRHMLSLLFILKNLFHFTSHIHIKSRSISVNPIYCSPFQSATF